MLVDAYPAPGGRHFELQAGAAISCWLAHAAAPTGEDALAVVARHLADEGWIIGRVIERQIVDADTYRARVEGRSEYETALTSGFVGHIHTREREVIALADTIPIEITSRRTFDDFVDRLHRDRAWALCSRADDRWARDETPDGDDFLPLWSADDDASAWADRWPDHRARSIDVAALCAAGGVLDTISQDNAWVALGRRDAVTTLHPLMLRDALLARRPR